MCFFSLSYKNVPENIKKTVYSCTQVKADSILALNPPGLG